MRKCSTKNTLKHLRRLCHVSTQCRMISQLVFSEPGRGTTGLYTGGYITTPPLKKSANVLTLPLHKHVIVPEAIVALKLTKPPHSMLQRFHKPHTHWSKDSLLLPKTPTLHQPFRHQASKVEHRRTLVNRLSHANTIDYYGKTDTMCYLLNHSLKPKLQTKVINKYWI